MDEGTTDGWLNERLALCISFILWKSSCEDNHCLMIVISFVPNVPSQNGSYISRTLSFVWQKMGKTGGEMKWMK